MQFPVIFVAVPSNFAAFETVSLIKTVSTIDKPRTLMSAVVRLEVN